MPVERADREEILLALADAGAAVVKLRAWSEEQQTHKETWSYPEIMDDLLARRRVAADAITFVGGSMHDALRTSRGFVTVSSTAALEAMAMNRPTLIISDFGVSAEMINLVFEESGCLGTLDDLRSGRLCHANPKWLDANYFHASEENNWLGLLTQLLAVRAAGQLLPRPRFRGSLREAGTAAPPLDDSRQAVAPPSPVAWCRQPEAADNSLPFFARFSAHSHERRRPRMNCHLRPYAEKRRLFCRM